MAPAEPRKLGSPEAAEEKLRGLGRVALVHDYLNQKGGAERVALELSDIWPSAPIYTSLYRPGSTFPEFADRDVRQTFLKHLPVDGGFRNLFVLYPPAFHRLGAIDADLVLASSSGWAHMAQAAPEALHAVYCHTPARWLYSPEYLGRRSVRLALLRPMLERLRRADRAAALKADVYIANSEHVRERIRRVYGIEAEVVAPPVSVERFCPSERGERLLVISRLLPYKHVDLIVRAASKAGIGLDVVGDGPLLSALSESAGPGVTLHGSVSDDVIADLIQGCRAVCVAAEEDFGIVSVEAQAAGKPVIAYGRGGSLETVEEAVTGVFFQERTEEAVIRAIKACDRLDSSPELIAQQAQRFSPAAFRARLGQVLSDALEARRAAGTASIHAGTQQIASRRPLKGRRASHPRGRKLRVVYLDHVAQLSGGELALLRLLKASSRDVEPHVILAEDGPLVERLRGAGIAVEVLPMKPRTRQLGKGAVTPRTLPVGAVIDTACYGLRLARRLRQLDPDLVHTNSLKAGIYGSLAARIARKPVVWHLRDRLAADYLPRTAVLLTRILAGVLPQVVVSNSDATLKTLRRRRNAMVIPSVVEPVPSEPRREDEAHESLVVGMVGRLAPWKGQDVFLRAFARAFRGGSQRAVIVGAALFGEAETAYAASLQELAHELGISDQVDFRGHRDAVFQELAAIDVLVHASTVPEPFGQVVVEGMAAALPVVASSPGGPAEVITHGVDGLLYPAGDVDSLAALLVRLDAEPELRSRLAQAAAHRARAFFPEAVAPKLLHAYELAQAAA